MAGNRLGGLHAAKTNQARYGKDFYSRIGAMGGKKGRTGGFYANRELARIAGSKGGKISKRGRVKEVTFSVDFEPTPRFIDKVRRLFT